MSVGLQRRLLHAYPIIDLEENSNEINREHIGAIQQTLIPLSPVAATTLRLSNCNPVIPWSYLRVSNVPPVRRSHIYPVNVNSQQRVIG